MSRDPLSVSPRGEDGRLMADVELIAEKDMGEKENIAPCQKYVGWADIESVEYKYPPRNAVKYVLRITLVGSSNS